MFKIFTKAWCYNRERADDCLSQEMFSGNLYVASLLLLDEPYFECQDSLENILSKEGGASKKLLREKCNFLCQEDQIYDTFPSFFMRLPTRKQAS